VSLWTRIPRGVRDKVERVAPEAFWVWLHQLREIETDRRWTTGRLLRAAHPSLAAPEPPRDALRRAEARVYSQNGEDGILAWLFERIGVTTRTVVEFGIGDGTECNAANLLLTFGWNGALLDADAAKAERARAFYAGRAAVQVVHRALEPDNVDDVLSKLVPGEVDLLSLDIDGNDYWVWQALSAVRARVVAVEYNASFGPARSVTVPYRRGFDRYGEHASGFYHGASLAALAKLGTEKGYLLAGCDSRGANAFLVDRAAAAAAGLEELSPADAFHPLYERAHLSVEQQWAQIAHLPLVEIESDPAGQTHRV
jgi:hypothetical protein